MGRYTPKPFQLTPVYKDAVLCSIELNRTFFKNNRLLLDLYGLRYKDQISGLNAKGLNINIHTINNLIHGNNHSCNTIYLGYFAVYWNLSILDMLRDDLIEWYQDVHYKPDLYKRGDK